MVTSTIDVARAIDEFLAKLSKRIHINAAVLYGSCSNGTAGEWSDIDLAVVSSDFEGMRRPLRQELLAEASLGCEPSLSPLGFAASEYTNPGPYSFLAEIIRTGKVVYPPGE